MFLLVIASQSVSAEIKYTHAHIEESSTLAWQNISNYSSGDYRSDVLFSSTNDVVTLSDTEVFTLNAFSRLNDGSRSYSVASDGELSNNTVTGSGYYAKFNDGVANGNETISATKLILVHDGKLFQEHGTNGASFFGPGTVKLVQNYRKPFFVESDPTYINFTGVIDTPSLNSLSYQIGSDTGDNIKFSVSLDNDGDRVAVGYKEGEGTAVVKVYEYTDGSWNQLGEDVQ